MRSALAALASLAFASGCAATSPILAEPRALSPGEVRLQGGGAALAPILGDSSAPVSARETMAHPPAPGPGTDDAVRSVLPGAAVAYAMRPGVAPIARATVGLQPGTETWLHYGGRDVGLGLRHVVFEHRTEEAAAFTLSIGATGHAILRQHPEDDVLAGARTDDGKGFGGTIPFMFGWQSEAGIASVWVATQVGYDAVDARVAFPTLEADRVHALSMRRTFGAATVGLSLGFRGIRAAVELGLERDWLHFEHDLGDATIRVWSLAPAFAISTTL